MKERAEMQPKFRRALGSCLDRVKRLRLRLSSVDFRTTAAAPQVRRVLVVGVYLTDRPSLIAHLVQAFSGDSQLKVEQRWAAIGRPSSEESVKSVTRLVVTQPRPKNTLVNELLLMEPHQNFDYILIVDDDIVLPRGFLQAFLNIQAFADFALAQPARTGNSWIDHQIVRECPGTLARQTRFVEIGPLVSIRSDLAPHILPLEERSPMGWGLDFIWPVIVEDLLLRMGIVDATPMDHSLREPKSGYSHRMAHEQMRLLLGSARHLTAEEAHTVIASIKV